MTNRIINKNENKKEKNNKENIKENKFKNILSKNRFLRIFIILVCSFIAIVLFLLYGPFSFFRDWYITSAMTTMNHKYLAYIFYSNEMIEEVLSKNLIYESDDITDLNLINFEEKTYYENEYEKQILERDKNNNDYKIIEIKGNGYKGYLVAIYEPSRVKTVVTKNLGKKGQYLTELAKENNALIAINGGGFSDPNFKGTGGTPLGITVANGRYITSESYYGSGGLIGFTEDNKLVLGKLTKNQAKTYDIRDGVTFGPFLINNGEPSIVKGNGGWGTAPRTAIGQREDGIVLFLVLDGRTLTNPGANMLDIIEIMERYGAVTAANLDGGTSTALVVDGTIVNTPINSSGKNETRPISTAFILIEDDEDCGDKSVVLDKLK